MVLFLFKLIQAWLRNPIVKLNIVRKKVNKENVGEWQLFLDLCWYEVGKSAACTHSGKTEVNQARKKRYFL